jgi:two-component system, cell cycle sensor histidine kinase and response regulator CckA
MAKRRIAVLVVDVEPIDIRVVETCLRSAGYSIFTAACYDAALTTFETHMNEIDLLLADISLPGKTGIELAISCLSRKPTLRVLFMSGWGTEFLDYVDIPKDDPHFLAKPFRASTLRNRVCQVLDSTDPVVWLDKGNKVRFGGFTP